MTNLFYNLNFFCNEHFKIESIKNTFKILFFISWFYIRIYLIPSLYYFHFYPIIFKRMDLHSNDPKYYGVCVFAAVGCFINIGLNYCWFYFACKIGYKMVMGKK